MNALLAKWTQMSGRFAALTRRERSIVAGAALIGGGFLIFSFAVDPSLAKARTASRVESVARTEATQLQSQLAMLKLQNADPDAGNRTRLEQAKKQLADVSGRLVQFEEGMVPPARMQAFLEGLLAKNRTIELLGLKTLPVTRVGAALAADTTHQAGSTPAPMEGIYQHGIEIRLAGSYNELLNYLAELERMPQRLMWNSVNFTVDQYPRNSVVLRVYTLSLDRNWLIV
ncbi:MAG: hypothetical protein K9J74_11610 [Sulfuritalea sp.]|nr:hypothetical protein [Sulfuritalea sp.]